jgi:hypothetical protein
MITLKYRKVKLIEKPIYRKPINKVTLVILVVLTFALAKAIGVSI